MTDPTPTAALEVREAGTDVVLPPLPVDHVATAVASMGSKMTYARALAQSSLIPAGLKVWAGSKDLDIDATAANLFLVMEYGQLLDLHPVTALSEVNVVKGKPGMSAKLMRARVRQAGHKLRILTAPEDRRSECTVKIILADDPEGSEPFTFTVADAAAMDLCKLNPDGSPSHRSKENKILAWESMTDTMLLERATAKAVRGTCPEILMGVGYTIEELDSMAADAPAPTVPVAPEDVPSAAWCKWAKAQVRRAVGGDPDKARALWAETVPGNPEELSENEARAIVANLPEPEPAAPGPKAAKAAEVIRADATPAAMEADTDKAPAPTSAPEPAPARRSAPATPTGEAATDAAGDIDGPALLSKEAQDTLVAEIQKLRDLDVDKLVEVGNWATAEGMDITVANLPNLTTDDFTKLMKAIRAAVRTVLASSPAFRKGEAAKAPAKKAASKKAAAKKPEPDGAEAEERYRLRSELVGRAELLPVEFQRQFLTELAEGNGPSGVPLAEAIESCPPAWDAYLTALVSKVENDAAAAEPAEAAAPLDVAEVAADDEPGGGPF